MLSTPELMRKMRKLLYDHGVCDRREGRLRRRLFQLGKHPANFNRKRFVNIQRKTGDVKRRLLAISGPSCWYCGSSCERPHIDHMTPVCAGGCTSIENLVLVCPKCNGSKSSVYYADLLRLARTGNVVFAAEKYGWFDERSTLHRHALRVGPISDWHYVRYSRFRRQDERYELVGAINTSKFSRFDELRLIASFEYGYHVDQDGFPLVPHEPHAKERIKGRQPIQLQPGIARSLVTPQLEKAHRNAPQNLAKHYNRKLKA